MECTMKNNFGKIVTVFLILFLIPVFGWSQQGADGQSEDQDETTVEELFLQSVEMRIIGEQAFDENRSSKLSALDNLEELVEDGQVAAGDAEATYILDRLSSEGIGVQLRENGRLINNFPEVRRRASELLGRIGGESAKDTLINVLLSDDEPMVLAEAVYALGEMAADNENNQITQAISFSILNQDIMTPDQNFAYAALLSIEKLAEHNNGLNDPSIYRALIRMSQGNYINTVQDKAQEVLRTLMTY